MRLSPLCLSGFTVPSGAELEGHVLLNRLRSRRRVRFSPRALAAGRAHIWAVALGAALGAVVFLGPWLADEWREMLGKKFVPVAASRMPRTSPAWWENEWRKGNAIWRAGEARGAAEFVRAVTGRDWSSAEEFCESGGKDKTEFCEGGGKGKTELNARPFLRRLALACGRGVSVPSRVAAAKKRPRVFVPLCGDSQMIGEFAARGFEVDAVDASKTAMRTCVERTERELAPELFPLVHLHWKDIFSPELWDGPLRGRKFDVIYERQGITSINREQRADYAFLLKQALAQNGVMYIEGTFRTGRVKGNALHGPPYAISKRELEELFPAREGFVVQCEETNDAITKLSRENRLLRRVPKELYVTPFHCVVYRKGVVREDDRVS